MNLISTLRDYGSDASGKPPGLAFRGGSSLSQRERQAGLNVAMVGESGLASIYVRATPLPVLVEMRELPKPERPQSDDPDFWDVWTGEHERDIDWGDVADRWAGG